ncbi:hypothetical protein GCM10020258_07390 [Sphingomonas yabuuchiae]
MIAIRAARPDDAAAIAAIYAPHVLAGVVSFETQAPDADTMRARMEGRTASIPGSSRRWPMKRAAKTP